MSQPLPAIQKAAPAAHPHRGAGDGRVSLLRLSAVERLAAAAAVLALLWAGVYWALN